MASRSNGRSFLFVAAYNAIVSAGEPQPLEVIHGYGSTKASGKIKRRLQEFLKQHSDCVDEVISGDVLGNPGITIVHPRWRLPEP